MVLTENAAVQFAGNVLVYGGISPCDGDWFGGVTQHDAERFLDRLVNMEVRPYLQLSPLVQLTCIPGTTLT